MFISVKIGYVWKHVFLHHFVLSVVKEIESWVCKLPKALLSVANEQLLCSPKPPKDLFLQNLIIPLINLLQLNFYPSDTSSSYIRSGIAAASWDASGS